MSRAVVDRIEGAHVVLLVDGAEERRALSDFPSSVREGDVVDPVTLERDVDATENLREEVTSARAQARRRSSRPGDL